MVGTVQSMLREVYRDKEEVQRIIKKYKQQEDDEAVAYWSGYLTALIVFESMLLWWKGTD